MNKEELIKQLKDLQIKKDKLSYLLKKEFKTEKEFYEFKENNIKDFEDLKNIREEIRNIEWQLMSETEKQEYLEYQKKIKEKYSDD